MFRIEIYAYGLRRPQSEWKIEGGILSYTYDRGVGPAFREGEIIMIDKYLFGIRISSKEYKVMESSNTFDIKNYERRLKLKAFW
jgi:hypothetical protein